MGKAYLYEHHDGWEDLMYVSDHELSDIERFCPTCEEWDKLIGVVDSGEELAGILSEHLIYENSGDFTDCYARIMDAYYEYSLDDHAVTPLAKEDLPVGLFFFVNGNFAFAGCSLSEAET